MFNASKSEFLSHLEMNTLSSETIVSASEALPSLLHLTLLIRESEGL